MRRGVPNGIVAKPSWVGSILLLPQECTPLSESSSDSDEISMIGIGRTAELTTAGVWTSGDV